MAVSATHAMNAFLMSIVLVPVFARIADKVGLIDKPTARKAHDGAVPVIGGIAMFLSFLVATLLLERELRPPLDFVFGLAILVSVGVLDDARDMRAVIKLGGQTLAAFILVIPGWHVIADLGGAFGSAISMDFLAVPISVIFVVGMINAFNMLDGLDGVAGGVAVVTFMWLAVAAALLGSGGTALQTVVLLLLFSTLGFLMFNMRHRWQPRAFAFMGDAGSMMLGASVAFFVLNLSGEPARLASFPALLWLCALPAIDTLSLAVRRVLMGKSPLAPDRNHLHHLLLDAGYAPRIAARLIIAACFVTGGIGVLGAVLHVPDTVMTAGLFIPLILHALLVQHLDQVRSKTSMRAAMGTRSGLRSAGEGGS